MAPLIQTHQLRHVYSAGTPFEHVAIDNIDFSVEEGEFIGIIGHTGSGKSTFIQHLNGLLKPTSGQVLFNGEDIWKIKTRDVRFQVGMVFQYPEYQLFEESVFQDIAFGPRNMKLPEEEIKRRVIKAAQVVGITEDLLDKSPFELSGGQKRRVAIAGILAMQPKVLVLDEPTAGLDPQGRQSILDNIRAYRDTTGSAIIMVSHSMEEMAENVERLVVFNHAKIVMDGKPNQIFSRAAELKAIGLDIPLITEVVLKLREMGLDIDTSVFTVAQARDMILSLKGGKFHA